MAWKIKPREDKSIIVLLQLLLTTTLDEMRGLLKGTESENLVSKEIEKTAISIKKSAARTHGRNGHVFAHLIIADKASWQNCTTRTVGRNNQNFAHFVIAKPSV